MGPRGYQLSLLRICISPDKSKEYPKKDAHVGAFQHDIEAGEDNHKDYARQQGNMKTVVP